MSHWTFNGNRFSESELLEISKHGNPEGFIYYILNYNTGKIYIGRKSFISKRKIAIGKRATAKMIDKRGSKTKTVTKPSDWQSYTGSNKQLNEDISKGHAFASTILHICYTKKQMTYWEIFYQMRHDVLRTESYNDNIMGKFFRKDLINNKNEVITI